MANLHRHDSPGYAIGALVEDRYGDDITIHQATHNVEVRGATLSFAFRDLHPHDVSQVLDQANVYVRAGHHFAKPLMRVLVAGATCRASFYLYNEQAGRRRPPSTPSPAANDIFGP